MILHSQFNSAFQFRRPGQAISLFTIKITEMSELHRSIPPMRSTEHQATIPLKFLITIHNYANVLTIKQSKSLPGFQAVTSLEGIIGRSIQTLQRGENDSKQSYEIKAKSNLVSVIFNNMEIKVRKVLEIANKFTIRLL